MTGPAKNLVEFCGLAKRHVEACIVTYARDGRPPNAFLAAVREAGIDAEVIRERRAFDVRVWQAFREIVGRRDPHILQTHNIKSHFLAKASGIRKGRRWIAFHHGYTTTDFKMRGYNQLDRWSLPSADRVITVCQPFARELEAIGVVPQKLSVLHNSVRAALAVDAEAVADLREKLGISGQTRVILTAGRLSREKAQIDLIQAVSRLRPGHWKVVIAGTGPDQDRLTEAIARLGLQQYVLLVGHQHRLDLFYAMADIVALSSHSEGSPNVLLEAMAAGRAIAATAVGGVPEIATDGETALLVPSRDPVAMAQAIERLLNEKELAARLGVNARTAAAGFVPERYVESLLGIYREVLASA